MRIITRGRLRDFWTVEKAAERPLRAWEKQVKGVQWVNWSHVKQSFNSADLVGNCVVFDIGHNRYRLIARVMFDKGRVFILKIMTHQEYDRKDPKNRGRAQWENECGCHQPPPRRKG